MSEHSHHRWTNRLASVQGLLRRRLGSHADPEVRAALHESELVASVFARLAASELQGPVTLSVVAAVLASAQGLPAHQPEEGPPLPPSDAQRLVAAGALLTSGHVLQAIRAIDGQIEVVGAPWEQQRSDDAHRWFHVQVAPTATGLRIIP